MSRQIFIRVTASVIVAVVTLLALEGGYRAYKYIIYGMIDYPDVITVGLFQRDPLYGWIPTRNFRSDRDIPEKIRKNDRVIGPHFHKQITFNSLGYRGGDFSVRKDPRVYRIVILGESTTLNLEVDDSESWPSRLERKLEHHAVFKLRHGAQHVEVINAGVSRWRTREGLLRLQNEIRHFSPDLILVAFNWNDAGEWAVHRYDPNQPIPDETPWWASLKILHNLRVRYLQYKFDEAEYRSWRDELRRDREWVSAYQRNVLAMKTIASGIGATTILLNLPGLCRRSSIGTEEYEAAIVGGRASRAGFPWFAESKEFMSGLMADLSRDHDLLLIDASAYFEQFSGADRFALFGDEIHYSDAGSEEVAQAVFLALVQ